MPTVSLTVNQRAVSASVSNPTLLLELIRGPLGLTGWQALILLCLISLACLIAGSLIWLRNQAPINEQDRNVARPFVSLAALSTLALIVAMLHWWGLVILLDAVALMLIGVIFTEVLPNSK